MEIDGVCLLVCEKCWRSWPWLRSLLVGRESLMTIRCPVRVSRQCKQPLPTRLGLLDQVAVVG